MEPRLSGNNILKEIIIISGGSGYSEQVVAKVTGTMENDFELGPVKIENGKIVKVGVKKATTWNFVPLAFCKGENHFYGRRRNYILPVRYGRKGLKSFRKCCRESRNMKMGIRSA